MNATELIVDWLGHDAAVRDDMRASETFSDLHVLREFLENRIRKEDDLRGLRDDLVRYGTQYAPREIGDLKGFLDWSLAQVDWQVVHRSITDQQDEHAAITPVNDQATP